MTEEYNDPAGPKDGPAEEPALYNETHNAKNTPFKHRVEPASALLRELTEKDREEGGYLELFLGNSKASQDYAKEVIGNWLRYDAIRALAEDGRADETVFNKHKSDWDEYVATNHPGKTSEEVQTYASSMYTFMSELQDELKVRTRVMVEPDITNRSNRGSDFITSDIIGKVPGKGGGSNLKASERMRRSSLKAQSDKLMFDVLLRDSFVFLSFSRPSRTEMGNLINDIRRTIKGYVRSINNNSVTLARVASQRVVWDFIVKRITTSSVSGISDFAQLANVITYTDMEMLCTALIEAYNSKGANMHLRCMAKTCDWHQYGLIDPAKLAHYRPSLQTDEEAAIFANLINGMAKYTVEETRAMSRASKYGLESNRVYNEDKSLFLTIDPPTLAEAFSTFDFFIGKVNPQLAELRTKVINEEEYEAQASMIHNDLGATEFIHWISSFQTVPKPNSDETAVVMWRHEEDSTDFNQGLDDVIKEDDFLNKALTKFVLNKVPYMSRTFIGIRNYECPNCRQNQGDLQDPEKMLERQLGYTPIDPFIAFFTLTQLLILSQTVKQDQIRKEAHSE